MTSSPIESFYSGKSILVTGSTGFIGKVLIEKLLYSCPDIKRVYLLIRGAQGKSPQARMMEMIAKKPFTIRLKEELLRTKLVAIDSDLSKAQLGLSPESQRLLIDEVSLVFHVAASVKFEAPLEMNMRHNVVATKELLDFAQQFKQLVCFIHVSTAYSNCQLRQIDERVYKMHVPQDPMSLQVTKQMLDSRPNTYTFTKAMAETVASEYAGRMNVVIARPSIVMSAASEPTEGWVDTINGPVGLSVLGALGILQKIKVNSEVVFDLIPVDIVSNALVTIAWAATEKKQAFGSETMQVFNLTTGNENPCSFYHYFSTGRDEAYKKPSTKALRPLLTIPKQKGMNSIQYWVHKVFSHLLFAYIIDFLIGLFGQKKMIVKAVKRMHHANDMFDYFCSNQWNFNTDNVKRMRELQSIDDRKTFNCDVGTINWDSYARVSWLGCRRFILKETDESVGYAKKRYRVMCLVYYATKIIFLLAVTNFAGCCLDSKTILWLFLAPIYGVVYLL